MSIDDPLQATLEAFGANVRHYRELRGLSQSKLAAACGLEVRHVQRIEYAQVGASIATVVALSEVLDVPVPDLFRSATLIKKPVGRPPRGRAKQRG